jgi:hypothetical protein
MHDLLSLSDAHDVQYKKYLKKSSLPKNTEWLAFHRDQYIRKNPQSTLDVILHFQFIDLETLTISPIQKLFVDLSCQNDGEWYESLCKDIGAEFIYQLHPLGKICVTHVDKENLFKNVNLCESHRKVPNYLRPDRKVIGMQILKEMDESVKKECVTQLLDPKFDHNAMVHTFDLKMQMESANRHLKNSTLNECQTFQEFLGKYFSVKDVNNNYLSTHLEFFGKLLQVYISYLNDYFKCYVYKKHRECDERSDDPFITEEQRKAFVEDHVGKFFDVNGFTMMPRLIRSVKDFQVGAESEWKSRVKEMLYPLDHQQQIGTLIDPINRYDPLLKSFDHIDIPFLYDFLVKKKTQPEKRIQQHVLENNKFTMLNCLLVDLESVETATFSNQLIKEIIQNIENGDNDYATLIATLDNDPDPMMWEFPLENVSIHMDKQQHKCNICISPEDEEFVLFVIDAMTGQWSIFDKEEKIYLEQKVPLREYIDCKTSKRYFIQ